MIIIAIQHDPWKERLVFGGGCTYSEWHQENLHFTLFGLALLSIVPFYLASKLKFDGLYGLNTCHNKHGATVRKIVRLCCFGK